MKSIFRKNLIALLAIVWGVSSVQAQKVNMSRYITLTVKEGVDIKFDLWADAAGTPVKIVSGNQEKTVTVGKDWVGYKSYSAGAGTMTIYGDLLKFDCNSNNDNITALDISHNTELTMLYCYKNAITTLDVSHNNNLKVLYCYGNKFTTAAIDDIFCSLPDRKGQKNGEVQPAFDNSSTDNYIVLAANGKNATDKNWKVRYFDDNSDITGFTGNTECSGGVNMSRYITLTVEEGAYILLDIAADAKNTPVKIVSGDKEQTITVGDAWTGVKSYTAGGAAMTVYGDVLKLDCGKNGANITGLDASHNTQLQVLFCYRDSINSLDLSDNTQLKSLHCFEDRLSSLDVSKNKQLQWLKCHGNKLTVLDVSSNTQLKYITCYGNNFTTVALDNIYCSLPDRTGQKVGEIQPLLNASSTEKDKVLATNGSNATARNWKVQYPQNESDITGFTGTKQCENGGGVNMERYIVLTVIAGDSIKFDIAADAAGTPVKIVSGSEEQTLTVGTAWRGMKNYAVKAETMIVYGNVAKFNCYKNGKKITALDASHNEQLIFLDCSSNSLTSLDLSKNTKLVWLFCNKNYLVSLDLHNNTQLKRVSCYQNALTSLDIISNKELTFLSCHTNKLTSLDISNNAKLGILYCFANSLTSLDISKNTQLSILYCFANNLTTTILDDIYCSLPDKNGQFAGIISPLSNASSSENPKVLATNGNNAIFRNWELQYFEDDSDITGFTGTHQCTSGVEEVVNTPALAVYPNPVKDILHITADKPVHGIRIYNVYGMEIAYAIDTNSVDVSHLPAGVYIVRADGKVTRIIKK